MVTPELFFNVCQDHFLRNLNVSLSGMGRKKAKWHVRVIISSNPANREVASSSGGRMSTKTFFL
jgi:hypothetical protein